MGLTRKIKSRQLSATFAERPALDISLHFPLRETLSCPSRKPLLVDVLIDSGSGSSEAAQQKQQLPRQYNLFSRASKSLEKQSC